MQSSLAASHGTEDVFATDLLYVRKPRAARPVAEREALAKLGRAVVESPETILQTLTDVAVDVCDADSAGISMLEAGGEEGSHFRWRAISGVYSEHLGGMTPRDFSPCGTTIDRNLPQLVAQPGRYFSYFNEVQPPICEGLLVPFSLADKPVGTIWIVAHDDRRKFDLEDMRVLTMLSSFAAIGYEMVCALEGNGRVKGEGGESVVARRFHDPLLPVRVDRDNLPVKKGLSKRENEILLMTVRGVSPKKIGLQLEISVKTVATHRTRILRKLNLQGTFDLLRYALVNKLVDWSEVH